MVKKFTCILLCLLFILPLSACWDYRGINDNTIVFGVAVDKNEKTQNYRVTFEFVDLTKSIKEKGLQTKIVESEGRTIFDAVRNAKKRLDNKLYFGNTQVVIVSRKIAIEGGITSIVDWFLRNRECRETTGIIVSQQEKASDLLEIKGVDQSLVSMEIKKILEKDSKLTGSTKFLPMYKVYNDLKSEGKSLTLPAFQQVMNDKEPVVESNGLAVFNKDKLIGFLNASDTKYFLFATNGIKGGMLTLDSTEMGPDDVNLEITENKTKAKCTYENGQAKVEIKTETKCDIDELHFEADLLDEEEVKKIESAAEQKIQSNIKNLIKKVQSEYCTDIFGFGGMIYQKDPKEWKDISGNWDQIFQRMDVKVECKVTILNSALIKKTTKK